eukprot:6207761-Pleurochrysis_carterae.AAC.3
MRRGRQVKRVWAERVSAGARSGEKAGVCARLIHSTGHGGCAGSGPKTGTAMNNSWVSVCVRGRADGLCTIATCHWMLTRSTLQGRRSSV